MNLIFRIRITRFHRTSGLKRVSIISTISLFCSSRVGLLRSRGIFEVEPVFQFLPVSLSRFDVLQSNYRDTGWVERAGNEQRTLDTPRSIDKNLTANSNYIMQSGRRSMNVVTRRKMEERKFGTSQKGNRKKIMRNTPIRGHLPKLLHSSLSFIPFFS